MISKINGYLWVLFFKKLFAFWERLGFHITPVHFYQPIPDTRELSNELWTTSSDCTGIDFNDELQLDLLEKFSGYKNEYDTFPRSSSITKHQYYTENGYYEWVDGEVLYSVIRHFKPGKIFEIGSGFSTFLSAQAILENKKNSSEYDCELVAFEPFPNNTLKEGFPGLSKLVPTRIQDVPIDEFMKLKENDILFIDSSHVSKIGSDVQYEYSEILPRLAKGVIVHIHDIFSPSEYPKHWIFEDHKFWNEQYLVQAFLQFNNSFEILWAGSYMHLTYPDKLKTAFNTYKGDETWPRSLWLRRTK